MCYPGDSHNAYHNNKNKYYGQPKGFKGESDSEREEWTNDLKRHIQGVKERRSDEDNLWEERTPELSRQRTKESNHCITTVLPETQQQTSNQRMGKCVE